MKNELGEEITSLDMVREFARFVDECARAVIEEAWAEEFGRKPWLVEKLDKE